MKSKNKLLLASWILGGLYFVYLFAYFTGAVGGSTGGEQVGAALATAIIIPHMVVVLLAVIFNILGWHLNKRGFALTGAILYAVAMVVFPPYFFFVIIQMILSFVGVSKMKKEALAA